MKVEHREAEHRFVVRLGKDEAEMEYTRPGPGLLDIQHTYVPPSARGRGIAEVLAEAAFDFARERGDRVIPSCPFVRRWLESHPDEVALVDRRYANAGNRARP